MKMHYLQYQALQISRFLLYLLCILVFFASTASRFFFFDCFHANFSVNLQVKKVPAAREISFANV